MLSETNETKFELKITYVKNTSKYVIACKHAPGKS